MYDLEKIRCFIYRGGTSRGLFFHSEDIPEDSEKRDQMFLGLMGSPDIRQIDGLGGATTNTSKIVVISRSKEEGIDIEYDFYQVGIEKPMVDHRGMCGNLLAAAGLFAVDEKLVTAKEPSTVVSIRNTNTGKRFLVKIPVKDGRSLTQGTHKIGGVPRPGASILEEFLDPTGAVTGRLLPTGKAEENIRVESSNYRVSIVDSSHLSVFMRMEDAGLKGIEKAFELNSRLELIEHLEMIRGEAARLCGFVSQASDAQLKSPAFPRIVLVGVPSSYIALSGQKVDASEMDIRLYAVHRQRFHQSIAVTVAICSAAAALVPGSIVSQLFKPNAKNNRIRIGHPSGVIEVGAELGENSTEETPHVSKVIVSRTARRLMEGTAYYPRPDWERIP